MSGESGRHVRKKFGVDNFPAARPIGSKKHQIVSAACFAARMMALSCLDRRQGRWLKEADG
jgi:hypothetical protein